MPTALHEAVIDMFRQRPTLIADLLSEQLGMKVPKFGSAWLASAELNDVAPTEYRADAVITLNAAKNPVLATVIEVQLQVDHQKRRSWPAYVATAYARLGCTVVLLVVCTKPAVARWSAKPVKVGEPDFVLTPLVLGPEQIPIITDTTEAVRTPELTVLSTLAHGHRKNPVPLFKALLAALNVIESKQANLYNDLVLIELPKAAAALLEELMTATSYRYPQSDFARRHYYEGEAVGEARGEARGEAKALLMVLDARGFHLSEDIRTRVTECTDTGQLGDWIRRAATADKVQDVFG
jgi:hypothetical protein